MTEDFNPPIVPDESEAVIDDFRLLEEARREFDDLAKSSSWTPVDERTSSHPLWGYIARIRFIADPLNPYAQNCVFIMWRSKESGSYVSAISFAHIEDNELR